MRSSLNNYAFLHVRAPLHPSAASNNGVSQGTFTEYPTAVMPNVWITQL